MPDNNSPTIVQRIATKAIIVNQDGKVLILREANTYEEGTQIGKYGVPGGRLNIGEAFTDGLTREVLEETGLTIKIGKPVHVSEWHPVIKGVQNQIVGIFFLCEALSSDITLSEEHDDYAWVDASNVADYTIMEPENKVIESYANGAQN